MQELSPYLIRHEAIPTPPVDYRVLPTEQSGLADYWLIVRKRLRLIGAAFLSAVGLTGLVIFNLTPVYTARSTLLLEPQVPQVLDAREPAVSAPLSTEHDFYKTQYDILRSRSLAAKVISTLNLTQTPFFRKADSGGLVEGWWTELEESLEGVEQRPHRTAAGSDTLGVPTSAMDEYLADLHVEPRFGTQLVVVEFTSPDPLSSARIANAHVDAYIRRGMELKADAARNTEQFLSGKLAELKERVEKSEAALNSYRREHGVIDFSLSESGKGQMLEQRLTDLNNTLAKVEAERIALEAQHELIRKGEADALPAVMQNQLIQNLKQDSAQLAAQYAAMSSQFNPGYQPLDNLRAKLNQSRAQLAEEIGRGAHEVESDYAAASERERMLEQEIASVKSQALALNDASLQDAVLVREVYASRNLYKSVLERVRELDVSADAPASNVSVVDRAEPPLSPSSPRKVLSLLLSGLIGLVFGFGMAFLLEFFDDRLKSSEQVERELQLPSLALVPDFGKLPPSSNGRQKIAQGGATALQRTVNDGYGGMIVVSPENRSPASEVFHALRTALLFSQAGKTPRSILVTSAVESEGKTVTALNLAIAFAQIGSRVLLVDADLRRARCHEILGIENHSGLSDVLTGQKPYESVIHHTSTGLFFLSAGATCPNPAALLGSSAMRDLLVGLCKEYDHVLVDSPPLIPISDANALAVLVDGVLMIAGPSTSKRLVRRACTKLLYVGAKVFGVALTRVDAATADYYYYNPYTSYRYHNYPAG